MKKVLALSLIISVILLIYTVITEPSAWLIGLAGFLTGWASTISMIFILGSKLHSHHQEHIAKLEKDVEEMGR